jgi:hypothetical protein
MGGRDLEGAISSGVRGGPTADHGLDRRADLPNGMSGRYWQALGAQHAEALLAHGFDAVKRVQALRYFTWRCGRLMRLRPTLPQAPDA